MDKAAHISTKGGNNIDISDFVAPLLNISTEGNLQREIKDVIDELDIMIHIYMQQKDVVKKFKRDVERLLQLHQQGKKEPHQQGKKELHQQGKKEKKEFGASAQGLMDDVDDRIAELRSLKRSAESTSTSVGLPTTGIMATLSLSNVDLRQMLIVSPYIVGSPCRPEAAAGLCYPGMAVCPTGR
jgi:soluble P-type ATPase